MPYLITTYPSDAALTATHGPATDDIEASARVDQHATRRAALTLDDAAEAAYFLIEDALNAERAGARVVNLAAESVRSSDAYALPESGGRIGPLPDGTTIAVEQLSGYALLQRIEGRTHREDWTPESVVETFNARQRLEYLRGELRAERISMGELHELQGLAEYIAPGDVELLEPAGVPEFPESDDESPAGSR